MAAPIRWRIAFDSLRVLRRPAPQGRYAVLGAALTVGLPLAVLAILVEGGTSGGSRAIELLLGLIAVIAVARWPGAALGVVFVYVPLQLIVLPLLFRLGMPSPIVRGLGGVKEVVTLGVLVAGISTFRRERHRLDALDIITLLFIGLVSLYLVLPLVVHYEFANVTWNVRLLAWRSDALWLVLFFGARHIPTSSAVRRRLAVVVLTMAAIAGACALVEFSAPSAWNSFLVHVCRVPVYKAVVLGVYVPDPTDLLYHGTLNGGGIIRVGSILQSPLALGFYLYPALGLGLHRLARRRPSAAAILATALAFAAIVVTLTRSALLGALVVVLVALWQGISRLSPGRVRLAVVLLMAAVLVAPLAGSSNIGQRSVAALSGQQDANEHLTAAQAGLTAMVDQPLGRGLGTAPGIGNRFEVNGTLTSEDSYLQVGDELGVAALVLFVMFLAALLIRLHRSPDSPNERLSPAALLAAGVGLAVAGLFLHIWLDFSTALTFAGLAGAAVSVSRREDTAAAR